MTTTRRGMREARRVRSRRVRAVLAGGLVLGVGAAGTLAAWTGVAYLAFAVSSLGYLLWYWALARGGIARIGTLQFLQPVASLVLAVVILGEAMTLPLAACAAVVLAGTIFAHRG